MTFSGQRQNARPPRSATASGSSQQPPAVEVFPFDLDRRDKWWTPRQTIPCGVGYLRRPSSLPLLESYPAWNPQLHLCPEPNTTPKAKPRADTVGPLTHPLKAPMSITSPAQFMRIDPASVVAAGYAQFGGPIFDLHLDFADSMIIVKYRWLFSFRCEAAFF
jgi:hypothetical protein